MPKKIGKYEILEEVGSGGFGVVYRAIDPFIEREVAIKTLVTDDESMHRRFSSEAKIAGNLQHRHITTIYDYGIEGEVPYLVQEFLSGTDLQTKIEERHQIPLADKLRYLAETAMGLACAHENGVVHRDIKPANIRILDDDSVKIMDFGIARLIDQETRLTKTGLLVGTAAYLAPEQILGRTVDHRVDIFALGVVAYELLTFERPFPALRVADSMRQIAFEPHLPPQTHWANCPSSLTAWLDRCLKKDADDRYRNCQELLDALLPLREDAAKSDRVFQSTPTRLLSIEPLDPLEAPTLELPPILEPESAEKDLGGIETTIAQSLPDRDLFETDPLDLLESGPTRTLSSLAEPPDARPSAPAPPTHESSEGYALSQDKSAASGRQHAPQPASPPQVRARKPTFEEQYQPPTAPSPARPQAPPPQAPVSSAGDALEFDLHSGSAKRQGAEFRMETRPDRHQSRLPWILLLLVAAIAVALWFGRDFLPNRTEQVADTVASTATSANTEPQGDADSLARADEESEPSSPKQEAPAQASAAQEVAATETTPEPAPSIREPSPEPPPAVSSSPSSEPSVAAAPTLLVLPKAWSDRMTARVDGGAPMVLNRDWRLEIEPGSHEIEFRVADADYSARQAVTVDVEPGQSFDLPTPLAQPSLLLVQAALGARQATVTVNDRELGSSPLRIWLTPGEHGLWLTDTEGETIGTSIMVMANRKIVVTFELGSEEPVRTVTTSLDEKSSGP